MPPKVSIIILNWNGRKWKEMGNEWMWRARGKRQEAKGAI